MASFSILNSQRRYTSGQPLAITLSEIKDYVSIFYSPYDLAELTSILIIADREFLSFVQHKQHQDQKREQARSKGKSSVKSR